MIHHRQPSIATISIFPNLQETHLSISALPGYTKSLLRNLNIDDKIQHLVLANKTFTDTEQYLDNDIIVYRCWRKNSFLYLWDLLIALKKFPSLRVIHLQHEFNQFGGITTVALIPVLCFLIRFYFQKKLILTLHEVLDPSQFSPEFNKKNFISLNSSIARLLLKNYYKLLGHSVNLFLVHTDEAKNLLKHTIKLSTPINIIPHGVDNKTEFISKNDARDFLKIPHDKKVILFFGMMDKRKGIDLAVNACKYLSDDFLLLAVGGMSERLRKHRAYQKWFTELKLQMATSRTIRYDGFVKCSVIETYFRASDLVLLPYTQLGSSSGVLALSIGYKRSVLATEFVRPQLEAHPQLPTDSIEMKKAIEKYFGRPHVPEQEPQLIKESAWPQVSAGLSQIYRSLLLQRKPTDCVTEIESPLPFKT